MPISACLPLLAITKDLIHWIRVSFLVSHEAERLIPFLSCSLFSSMRYLTKTRAQFQKNIVAGVLWQVSAHGQQYSFLLGWWWAFMAFQWVVQYEGFCFRRSRLYFARRRFRHLNPNSGQVAPLPLEFGRTELGQESWSWTIGSAAAVWS